MAEQRSYPVVTGQLLSDCGLNPFALQLVAESILKHPRPIPVSFTLPCNRSDIPGFSGLRVYLEPVPADEPAAG